MIRRFNLSCRTSSSYCNSTTVTKTTTSSSIISYSLRYPSSSNSDPSATATTTTATGSGGTHYSFGGKPTIREKKRQKKDFHDLFETKGTVANDDESKYALWRLFWATPIDYADDTEIEDKKKYEYKNSMRGHVKKLYNQGEETIAKNTSPDSRFSYARKHVGGLFTLQMLIELFITLGMWALLEYEIFSFNSEKIQKWWDNLGMPFSIEFHATSEESKNVEPMKWPFFLSAESLNNLHTSHTIGSYSIPFQLILTWVMFPSLKKIWETIPYVKRFRRIIQQAQDEADRSSRRSKTTGKYI